MKTAITFILTFFQIFVFAQIGFIDKSFNLSSNLQKNELRIYILEDHTLYSSKVFVLKQKTNGKWKAKFLKQAGKDNIYVKNFKVKDGDDFWQLLKKNKPKVDTSSQYLNLHPDSYKVYWNKNMKLDSMRYIEPLHSNNEDEESMNTVYKFFKMIEEKFKFEFKN